MTVAGPTAIGRAPENDLALAAEGVSRQHARIVLEGDTFWLEDLSSSNGTFLNGRRITRERLTHLDVITLGQHADLIVDARRSDTPAVSSAGTAAEIMLEAVDGPDDGARLTVSPGELTVGRVAPSNVVIDSPIVSKLHARLRRTGDSVVLEDLHSSNGTFVNGQRITAATQLKDGDTISVARVRTFRVAVTGVKAEAVASAMPVDRGVTDAPVGPVTPVPPVAPGAADLPQAGQAFDQEWKTRLVWSPDELAVLEAERARIVAEVRRTVGALPGEAPDERPRGKPASPPQQTAPPARPAPAAATEFLRLADHPLVPPVMAPAPAGASPIRAVRLRGGPYDFVLKPGEHTVGRQGDVSVLLPDRQISRKHAVFTVSANAVTVEDAGSANGTSVNGQPIKSTRELHQGDRVMFGELELVVEFLYRD